MYDWTHTHTPLFNDHSAHVDSNQQPFYGQSVDIRIDNSHNRQTHANRETGRQTDGRLNDVYLYTGNPRSGFILTDQCPKNLHGKVLYMLIYRIECFGNSMASMALHGAATVLNRVYVFVTMNNVARLNKNVH